MGRDLNSSSTSDFTPSPCRQDQASCTCLSTMYLALTELQALDSFAFPAVIPVIRKAMHSAWCIIRCEKCPVDNFSAIQNVQSLSALLAAIGERFHRILQNIDQENERLEANGEKKPFRVGDNSIENAHLHTGTFDCPMGFDIELEPREWNRLSKKALRTEGWGGGGNPVPLNSLLDQFEARQNRWHADESNIEERRKVFGDYNHCKPGDAHCVRMIRMTRAVVENMKWE